MDWIPLTSTKSEKTYNPKNLEKNGIGFGKNLAFLNPPINLKKLFPL